MSDANFQPDEALEKLVGEALRTRTSRGTTRSTVFDRVQALERLYRSLADEPGGPALIYRTPEGAVRAHVLTKDTTTIGRGTGCDLSFPKDTWMSRQHCAICRENGAFILRDLKSKNGIYFDGRVRIVEHLLISGDSFKVGDVHFSFADAPSGGALKIS